MVKPKVTVATNEILIKNGFVYDPANGINGDVKDIAVQNGKIVEPSKLTTGAKVIDARGKTVMAGGVDIHTHVAGPKVNVGRMFRPEDKLHDAGMESSQSSSGPAEATRYHRPSPLHTGMPG